MLTSPESILAVETLLSLPLILLGLSHIFQKQMWVDFFSDLAAKGHPGVVWWTFMLELWPAMLIVVFHQDWSWPGIFVTAYGHILLAKVAVSLLYPPLGLKSLEQADRSGPVGFYLAGAALIVIGGLCGSESLLVI
ncbi:MAG: hypothetical protein AAGF33_14030 [Pseudomonadota bacterium]